MPVLQPPIFNPRGRVICGQTTVFVCECDERTSSLLISTDEPMARKLGLEAWLGTKPEPGRVALAKPMQF